MTIGVVDGWNDGGCSGRDEGPSRGNAGTLGCPSAGGCPIVGGSSGGSKGGSGAGVAGVADAG